MNTTTTAAATFPLIRKGDLCRLFGLQSPSGECYTYLLRVKVLTDDKLEKVGITPEQYKRERIFDLDTSRRIVEVLGISPEQLASLI